MLTEQGPIKLVEYLTVSNIHYDWSMYLFYFSLICHSRFPKLHEQKIYIHKNEDNKQKLGLSTDLQENSFALILLLASPII